MAEFGWISYEPDILDDILDKAKRGHLTPAEAESAAAAAGLGPLKRTPDRSAFDPMIKSRWPLTMAITWIAWRDLSKVLDYQDDYRAECRDWVKHRWRAPTDEGASFQDYDGWFLEPRKPVNVEILELHRIRQVPFLLMTVEEARKVLWRHLEDQDLIAEAIDPHDGKVVEIPDREWPYLQIYQERGRNVLKRNALDFTPSFVDVKFKRDDLLRIWPKPGPTASAGSKCKQWLVNQMEASRTTRPKPKSDFRLEAQRLFAGLSQRQFDRAWAEAAEFTEAKNWLKAGAPKK